VKRSEWVAELDEKPELNPDNWPRVLVGQLRRDRRGRFQQRKRALDLYFNGDMPVRAILRRCGLSKAELYRVRDRATSIRPDGQPWGYAACIPGFRIKEYARKATTTTGTAGRVKRFFEDHPDLLELLEAWVLGRKSPDVGKVRGRKNARIWAAFEKRCRKQSIDPKQMPSKEAVRKLCVKIRRQNFSKSTRLTAGKDAADISMIGCYGSRSGTATVPYQRVQMDGHRLDGVITLEVTDADGTRRDLPLERLWLLVIIDEASRGILGYTVSLESNYTSEDVMRCIAHCLMAWSPKDTPSPRVRYRPGAGLPSGVLPNCAMRGFDSLAFDNAKAHTSERMQLQIIRTVGCEINTGRPARALSRAIVERFFKTFEEDSLHRWPSTTGSGPKDPRRHAPDKAASSLRVNLEDLELAIDLTIANYNASAHTALNGRTPLEYIQYYDSHGLSFPRHLRENRADKLPLFDREFKRKIGGSEKLGRRPYVIFMGSTYTSPTLNTMIEQIGKKVTLVVNTEDIRYVACFLSDGTSIGLLAADEPWLRQRHSLRTRQAIMKLIKAGQLPRETYNPIGDHLIYLKKRAAQSRRDRNKLLKQAREAGPSQRHARLTHRPSQPNVGGRGWVSITNVHTQ